MFDLMVVSNPFFFFIMYLEAPREKEVSFGMNYKIYIFLDK